MSSQAMDNEAKGYKMHHLVRNSNTGLLELHEELTEEILKNGSIIRSSWSRESLVEHKKQLELSQEIKPEPPEQKETQIIQTYAQDDLLTEPYIKEEIVVDEESSFDALPDVFPKEENIGQDPLEITRYEASTSENFDKNKTLLSLSKFLKTSRKKITMDELEQFCIEKKCKVIVCKNDRKKLGFVSNHLKMQQQIIKRMDKKKVERLQQGPFRLDVNESMRSLQVSDAPTSQACTILLPSRKPEPANQLIKPPTRPILSARKVGKDVVLKWRMPYCSSKVYAPVASYEVYCYILNGSKRWRRMSKVESSELSMTFTLKNIDDDLIYYFGVRAIDVYKRRGLFSTEVTINNSKISSGCS
nr:PREDICTED: uncharacterized protein LOC657056 isoform X1 [Tribolium castaneum]XP_015840063.1 PREDICTED: uncharacterized protein LOC657056 isoform X1 [Tribolium castaneum]XP_015840064.1 PREDICTED: uncharacterized protein LOC657056 isoform X1 [Tribolium castaneum]XP_015840065.1 PREDICTED: uncharacterized protein LOC657056 isoform X1 [Tribolium castaneum]|eukprot:XP_015840062.1 PREDICTED: uncharacterized protein LOC657056 isoform X1 [Tribolium castaneum]